MCQVFLKKSVVSQYGMTDFFTEKRLFIPGKKKEYMKNIESICVCNSENVQKLTKKYYIFSDLQYIFNSTKANLEKLMSIMVME